MRHASVSRPHPSPDPRCGHTHTRDLRPFPQRHVRPFHLAAAHPSSRPHTLVLLLASSSLIAVVLLAGPRGIAEWRYALLDMSGAVPQAAPSPPRLLPPRLLGPSVREACLRCAL
eukprot:scaffold21393_cov122-Isochrysis_galbana.AAC.2